MTNIVYRLRAAAPGTMLSMQVHDLAALREAADEIERLRAMLGEALDIAVGSGVDFTWQADERIRELRAYQQNGSKE